MVWLAPPVHAGSIGEDTRVTRGAVALRAVQALLRELEAADRLTGVVGVTQGDQELLLGAFGYASRAWSIPATVETRFDTASITKLFTAVTTLQLVEEGAFALDTSVIGYLGLEDTRIPPEVTPYHLLTHTSGIADDADEEAGERYEDIFLERPNYSVIALTLELLSPKVRHSARGAGHQMGFGFEFETDADDVVRSYWKEGMNVGVSGMLRHYPTQEITVAVLAVGENAAWAPIEAIHEAVGNVRT